MSYSPDQYHESHRHLYRHAAVGCTDPVGGESAVSPVIPAVDRQAIPPQACRRSKGERAMAYGHAERNLALIRQLEAETRDLLSRLDQLDPEQSAWLQDVTAPGQIALSPRPRHRCPADLQRAGRRAGPETCGA
jgi:hypothetical protein